MDLNLGSWRKKSTTSVDPLERITETIKFIAQGLVDDPSQIEITIEDAEEEGIVKFKLSASKADLGKVIGKEGKMASALRTIVYALASKARVRANLEISE